MSFSAYGLTYLILPVFKLDSVLFNFLLEILFAVK